MWRGLDEWCLLQLGRLKQLAVRPTRHLDDRAGLRPAT